MIKKNIKLHMVCLLLTVKAISVNAQNRLDSIRSYLKSEMVNRKIAGLQTVIIQNGKVVLSEAYGIANIEHHVSVDHQTVFSINSATKCFTGVAVMQLVEDGKMDISLPIEEYLDNLPELWKPIKVKSLLNHTSGIPNFLDTKNGGYVHGLQFAAAWQKIK